MKKIIRSFVGLLSSLLFIAGLTHAAERLDPVTRQLTDAPQLTALNGPQSGGPIMACEHAGSRQAK